MPTFLQNKTALRKKAKKMSEELSVDLPPDAQEEWRKKFVAIDADKSGSITRAEFRAFLQEINDFEVDDEKLSLLWTRFDADGSGDLDFEEFIAMMVVMRYSICFCDACGMPIEDYSLWACKECWSNALADQKGYDFTTFCGACRKSSPAAQEHGAKHSLVQAQNDWQKPRQSEWLFAQGLKAGSAASKQAQRAPMGGRSEVAKESCSCCGDSHNAVEGYLTDKHLRRVNKGVYLCEWCTTAICTRCGKTHHAQPKPLVGMWSMRGLVCEPECKKAGGGGWSFTNSGLVRLAQAERPHCSTCRPRMLRGTVYRVPPEEATQAGPSPVVEGMQVLKDVVEIGAVGVQVAAVAVDAGCSAM